MISPTFRHTLQRFTHEATRGGVAEWTNAPVLKTGDGQLSGGSNPSPSAIYKHLIMSIISIIIIALALAMDAFAVAIASGITIKNLKTKHALTIGAWFGLFQAVMPLIGWFIGLRLQNFMSDIDHWIAFSLLSLVGCKMIYESFKIDTADEKKNPLDINTLLLLSIATSIDALAAGISFAMLDISIITPILMIGFITFLMSFAGVFIGNKAGHFFEKKIEIGAGIILIGIGTKILLEHLY